MHLMAKSNILKITAVIKYQKAREKKREGRTLDLKFFLINMHIRYVQIPL